MFKATSLFGGALSISIPQDFIDVSSFRQVPDHQEVFVVSDSNHSLIIEILELANVPDEESIQFHFQELAIENASNSNEIVSIERVEPNSSLSTSSCFITRLEGIQKIFKFNNTSELHLVSIYQACIRLHSKNTDILITFNIPSEVENKEWDLNVFDTLLNSFVIHDWNLFV